MFPSPENGGFFLENEMFPLRGFAPILGGDSFLSRTRGMRPLWGAGEFSFQETECAPHFFFSLLEKKKRAAPGAKKKRGLG